CLMLNEDAGLIDDVTVLRVSGDTYLIVSNAVTRGKVVPWLEEHAGSGVNVEDVTESTALLAVQGPASAEVVSRWMGWDASGMKWFSGRVVRVGDCPIVVTRSGYTGEDGFEICILCGGEEMYENVFESFLSMGGKPCGLACRDVLRLEAGYPLYGQDIDENVTPVEARLMWAIKMENMSFIGRQALRERLERGPEKLLVGLELTEPGVPRRGYKVLDSMGNYVGMITSGGLSYTTGRGIALGYIPAQLAVEGARLLVDLRGRVRTAVVRLEPFVRLNIPKH
ncbi:MAG: glycine cleavage T C-terminal barrel domain-containing protein, partial [Nitrososphaerota archaeon]